MTASRVRFGCHLQYYVSKREIKQQQHFFYVHAFGVVNSKRTVYNSYSAMYEFFLIDLFSGKVEQTLTNEHQNEYGIDMMKVARW